MKSLTSAPAGNIVPIASYTAGSYTLTGLIVGNNYYYTMSTNDTSIAFAGGATFAKSAAATGVFTATATSATLAGSGTSAITTAVYPILGVPLFPATVTPVSPAKLVSQGEYPSANPNWSRSLQISDEYVFVKRNPYAVAFSLSDIVNLALTDEVNLTWTPPVILNQLTAQSCVHSSTAAVFQLQVGSEYNMTYAWYELSPLAATSAGTTLSWGAALNTAAGVSLTSNNTTPADGDTVTIGNKVYTFKTTLTPTEGQVLINSSADAALLNLIRAINHTGTPNTDYKCAAAHPAVTAASSVTSHAFAVTPKALTTVSVYTVSAPPGTNPTYLTSSLLITPTDTLLNGAYYYCTTTDNAGSYGLTNGSVSSATAALNVT